jgi:hypothetical protein
MVGQALSGRSVAVAFRLAVTTLYISPERFYALATPPALLFSTEDDVPTPLLSGSISDIVQTVGAGAGKALIDLAGNPMGTFSVVVVCTAGGQINELGVVNPGSLPAFKLSVNAGVTFGRSRTVSVNDDRAYIDVISGPVSATAGGAIGLRIIALPGIFAVGDTFTATTAPYYQWDIQWEMFKFDPRVEEVIVGSPDGEGVNKLSNGNYVFVIKYNERRNFGDLIISRDSAVIRSFSVRQ